MQKPAPTPRPPWQDGNDCRLLADGSRYFPAMIRAIAEARTRVALEMYLVQSGSISALFIDTLCAAAQRGVAVYVLVDDFGGRGLSRAERRRLGAAGAHFATFNPITPLKLTWNLVRDHRKLLLVDDDSAFVGGAGLSDAFDSARGDGWRDNMLQVRGPCVADWWAVFAANWRHWSPVACNVPDARAAGRLRGRVLAGGRMGARALKSAALRQIRRARRRVWLSSPYFLPPWKLRRALVRAVRRGCDVRLLLPGPRTDHAAVRAAMHRLYAWMLRRGVRIYEYQPAFMHAKTLLTDDVAMVGSCNFDRWSLRWNLEANQQIDDPAFAARLAALLARDFAAAREITRTEWQRRPWLARLRERFWGHLETLAVRASYREAVRDQARRRGDPRVGPSDG